MAERMTLANMSAELGAQVGLIAPDETTRHWLAAHGAPAVDIAAWHTDEAAIDAPGCETHRFDAAALEPFVAAPHSPANAQGVGQLRRHAGRRRLHRRLHRRQARRPARCGRRCCAGTASPPACA